MTVSRPRVRPIAAAAIAVLAAGGLAVPAHAALDVSASFDASGALPVAKAQYFEVGPSGTASLYTPSLHDGQFAVHVAAQGSGIGQVVARTDFPCPADTPHPVLQLVATGPRGSAAVGLHVQGVSKAPDGTPITFDQTVNNGTGIVSTFSETQLLKQCSE
jgi:hypothetical protein